MMTGLGHTRTATPRRPQGLRNSPKEEYKYALLSDRKSPDMPTKPEVALIRQFVRMSVYSFRTFGSESDHDDALFKQSAFRDLAASDHRGMRASLQVTLRDVMSKSSSLPILSIDARS